MRSTRKVRQSARSTSQATRYQRRPQVTSRYGSTVRPRRPRRRGRGSRTAAVPGRGRRGQRRSARAGSTAGPGARAAPARCRRLQRVDPVAQPRRQHLFELGERAHRGLLDAGDAPPAAVRSPTATATASSSSSSSGGMSAPAPSRYPPAVPRWRSPDSRGRAAGRRRGARSAPLTVEPLGEVGAGPVASALQQRQQAQQARRGLQHGLQSARPSGPKSDRMGPSVAGMTTTPRSGRSASTSRRPTSTTCATGWPAPAGPTSCPDAGWDYGVPVGVRAAAGRPLARRLRLARLGGAAQPVPAVHHRRSTGRTSTSCTSARPSRTPCR